MGFLFKLVTISCVSLLSTSALAQELNFQEYRKFLMQGNQQSGGKKMAIETTCTTPEGQTYRIGEKEYDTCLNGIKAAHNQKQLTGQNETKGSNVGTSTTIHFGN
ncbi:hypothetical protein [Bdellovibrio sp. HCB337]|uniref:hypothetical protein n=1 Tax=Bdellovibrio sp. HCB337 TaxID=3394358 RepID=UPI0039A755E8